MPKEYRERIIDEKPFRVVTLRPKRNTTTPDENPPSGIVSTVITLTPGDAVLWFLRLATADSSPSGRMVSIITEAGDPVSHTYTDQPAGWADSLYNFYGNFGFDSEGNPTVDDTIYVIWDQFDGFTEGDYRLSWGIPETDRAHVEGAFLLHGMDTTDQGTLYNGRYETPTYEKFDVTGGGGYNNFPVSVPTANHSLVYGIWEMSGSVTNPAGFTTVPGTTHLSYTFDDDADPPELTQSIVSRLGVASTSTLSVATPTTGSPTGAPGGTSYYLAAIVLNSATGITYETVTFDA